MEYSKDRIISVHNLELYQDSGVKINLNLKK